MEHLPNHYSHKEYDYSLGGLLKDLPADIYQYLHVIIGLAVTIMGTLWGVAQITILW
jgi:hypothetical protein